MTPAGGLKITLLGTGSPVPSIERFGPSTLVEAGDQKLLIDAGRGATIRLNQIGVPLGRIDALLLTHFHSDHTAGIPDLWLTGWLEATFGCRRAPFRVIGPPGAKRLMHHLERAYADDIEVRMADEKLPRAGVEIAVEEFAGDRAVYERNGLRVVAFEVDHGDLIKPAFGYRIEYDGRVVTLSGDTRVNENVVRHGAGADVLIHEVAVARPELTTEPHIRRILAHHTSPEEAGTVFARCGPKLAVYTHTVFLSGRDVPPATRNDLLELTRRTYAGRLEIGEDLMCIEVGKTITVRQRTS